MDFLETTKDNLIALRLTDKLSQSDIETLHERMDEILEHHDQVDFYFEFHEFEGYTPKGLWEDIKVDAKHHSDYGKMAFVGDKEWLEKVAQATDLVTDSEVKYFPLEEIVQAKAWIGI
ncbi:STAS/SEC14 domain-containing protein [Pseudidiomarina insulisalsae]|uniref:STAS/SEC14 domain-containing protein n=1 Tax=Pseudidiomarina insulisalsae TaxID=575789 RepID=A0A432YPX4_9GAMM|nr:STAS/SEC14 domain-containing protein [Pseudidiomarina insulisalsae]RUO63113.1 STAS/SEC14 domain-containing protein [Pseudidiomarina insulisalsae]